MVHSESRWHMMSAEQQQIPCVCCWYTSVSYVGSVVCICKCYHHPKDMATVRHTYMHVYALFDTTVVVAVHVRDIPPSGR